MTTVRLRQSGDFRLGDQSSAWKPFEAVQHFTVNPPGFVWDARIEMAPLIAVRVVDLYRAGAGALRAKVLSTVTVADQQGSPELNSGELMRFLAECVWFPTALAPGQGVEWSPIDARSARATLEDRGTRVSLLFYFNERDEVERVHAEGRYAEVGGTYQLTPWTGYFSNYQRINGLLVPVDARVEWNFPEGDLPYWRARLYDFDHLTDGKGVP